MLKSMDLVLMFAGSKRYEKKLSSMLAADLMLGLAV